MHHSLARIAETGVVAGALLACALLPGRAIPPAARADTAVMTLTFYDGGLYTSYGSNATKAILAGYEKLHPTVTIKVIPYSGNYVTDISTALAGGTTADVVVPTAEQQIWSGISKGYWQDLTPYTTQPDPYLPGKQSLAEAMLPGTLAAQRAYDGKYYALSATAVDQGFIYNKKVFAAAGISTIPATWDQLIGDLKRIKAAGYVPFELQLGDTLYGDTAGTMLSVIEGQVMGRTIKQLDLNHDGQIDVRELALGIKSGAFSARNPEYQEAVRLYEQLYPYAERGAAGVNLQSAERGFISGHAGIYYDGLWDVGVIDSAKPNFSFGFFPLPQVTRVSSSFAYPGFHGTSVYGPTGAVSFAIPVSTAKRGHLAQAIDFIDYLTSVENTDILDKTIVGLSILKGGHNDPRFAVFTQISEHPSALASAELTFPPSFEITRQQLLVDHLTGQKSWADLLTAMQSNLTSSGEQVLTSYQLH